MTSIEYLDQQNSFERQYGYDQEERGRLSTPSRSWQCLFVWGSCKVRMSLVLEHEVIAPFFRAAWRVQARQVPTPSHVGTGYRTFKRARRSTSSISTHCNINYFAHALSPIFLIIHTHSRLYTLHRASTTSYYTMSALQSTPSKQVCRPTRFQRVLYPD